MVIGLLGGFAQLVPLEEIELHLRTEGEGNAHVLGLTHRLTEQLAGVGLEGGAVGPDDAAEHAGHPAMVGPPGQQAQRGRVRLQKQVGAHLIAEAGDGRGVKGDAVLKRPVKLVGMDGDILLPPRQVAEGQADELDVLLRHILPDFLFGILHSQALPFSVCRIHLPIGAAVWVTAVQGPVQQRSGFNEVHIISHLLAFFHVFSCFSHKKS